MSPRRHSFRASGLIVAAAAVALVSAATLVEVSRVAGRAAEGATTSQRLATLAQTVSTIEWQAIASHGTSPQLVRDLRTTRARVEQTEAAIIRSGLAFAPDLHSAWHRYIASVEDEFAALARGDLHGASEIDERRVDPQFLVVQRRLGRFTQQLRARAGDTRRQGLLATIAVLLLALAAVVLLALRSQRAKDHESAVIKASKERFHALVDDASDMITTVARDGSITGQSSACSRILGYEPEAMADFGLADLVHPDDAPLALALLRQTASDGPRTVEWRMRHRNGFWVDVETAVNDMFADDRVGSLILTTRDVSDRKALEEQLRHRAFHDPLTQLPNRALFLDRTEHALSRDNRYTEHAALLFIDLDDFKLVNDRLGHAQGDEVLVLVAQRLRACLRSADTAARLGGDEFGVLLESVEGAEEPLEVARRILQSLALPLEVGARKVTISPSVGVAIGRCQEDSAPELLRRSDVAMYAAKRNGKACLELYRDDVHGMLAGGAGSPAEPDQISAFMRTEDQRAEISALLRDPDGLNIVFQPIVDLRTGVVAGYEALSRFTAGPSRAPNAWFAQAHRCGLGVELELTAIARALAAPGRPEGTYLSLNVSPSSLGALGRLAALPDDLSGILIEVTENELVTGGDTLPKALAALRERGARIAVDDAGSGYAGLRQLTALAPDVIKLDRSIVDGLSDDSSKLALIESFVRFAAQIGASICAEGIEQLDDLCVLAEIDVALGQGYVLGRPGAPWAQTLEPAKQALREATDRSLEQPLSDVSQTLDGNLRLERVAAELSLIHDPRDSAPALVSMAAMLNADAVSFSLLSPDGTTLRTEATTAGPADEPAYTVTSFPLTARAISEQRAFQVFAGDPHEDEAELAVLAELGYEGMLMLPISLRGVTIGLLEIYVSKRRPWSRHESVLARLFAYQLAALAANTDDVQQRQAA